MAHHCPIIRCFDWNEYGHVAADCPDKIPQSGTPAHHGKHHSSVRHQTRSTSQHNHRDWNRFSRSRSHLCTHRYRSHSQNTSQMSHSRSIMDAPTEAHHATDTQTLIITNGIHHIGGLPHIEALLHILETALGLDHILCIKLVKQQILNLHTALSRHHGNTRLRNIKGHHWWPPIWLLQFWWTIQWFRGGFKLRKPSLSTASHEWGGLPAAEIITVACITDCPTITVHAGKHYKALVNSGAMISLLRYSK